MRVLIVDDNRDLADDLAEIMAQEGHLVRVAYGGKQALEEGMASGYQVALIDLRLPDTDGVRVAEQLMRELPDARYFFMTGWSDADLLRRATAVSSRPIFYKPLEIPRLLAAVSDA